MLDSSNGVSSQIKKSLILHCENINPRKDLRGSFIGLALVYKLISPQLSECASGNLRAYFKSTHEGPCSF